MLPLARNLCLVLSAIASKQLLLRRYLQQCDNQDFASAEATNDNSSVTNADDIKSLVARSFITKLYATETFSDRSFLLFLAILYVFWGPRIATSCTDEHGDATPYSGRQGTDLGCKRCACHPSGSYSGACEIYCLLRRGYMQRATRAVMFWTKLLLHTRGGRSFTWTSVRECCDNNGIAPILRSYLWPRIVFCYEKCTWGARLHYQNYVYVVPSHGEEVRKIFVLLPLGYWKVLELTFKNVRKAEFRTVCVRLSVCESL